MNEFPTRSVPLAVFVGCLVVASAALGAVVVAENSDGDGEPTAERSLNVTDPDPGDTVNVTLSVELPTSASVDYIDEFEPAFGEGEYVVARVDGNPTFPFFQDVTNESAIVVFDDDTGPGTLDVVYQVTVSDDADVGTVHEFNGTLQVNETEVPIDGQSELTVGGETGPVFDVEIDEEGTDESVVAGEEATVVATVENTGDESGTQEVTLSIDGSEEASESVTLAAGETESVTFGYETSEGDVPEVEATVASDDDTASTTISVEEAPDPADFQLSDLDPAEETVTEGDDPIDVTVDVTNEGEESGEQDVVLEVVDDDTGEVAYTDTVADVALDADGTETVTFEDVPAGDLDPGEYTHSVSSENDTIAGSLTVEEAPDPADFQLSDLDPEEATVTEGDDPIDVSVNVTNEGDESGEQDVVLEVVDDDTGDVAYSDTVEDVVLDPNDMETVTFEDVPAGNLDPGEYTHEASSDDDAIAGSLTVEEAPDVGELAIDVDPAEADADSDFTYSFNASEVDDETDVEAILIDFDDASGVDASAIEEDDVSIDGDDTGTVGVDDTSEEAPGVLRVVTADTFTLQNEDGDLSVSLDGVEVPNDGEFDGAVEFLDDGDEEITSASDTYNIDPAEISEGDFQVAFTDQDSETIAGEEQTFDVEIENDAEEQGQQTVELDWGDGAHVVEEVVTLDPNDSTTETFTVQTDDDEFLGEYDVEVSSENDTDATDARINPERIIEDDETEPGDTVDVTVRAELAEPANVTLIETYAQNASSSSARFPAATYNDDGFNPTLPDEFDAEGGLMAIEPDNFPADESGALLNMEEGTGITP